MGKEKIRQSTNHFSKQIIDSDEKLSVWEERLFSAAFGAVICLLVIFLIN